MITLQKVSKEYGIGKRVFWALKNVSLSIKQGEFVAILGPSGSGKSTLMHIIGGLDKPTSGHVIIDDRDLSSFTHKQLAEFRNKKVGFVFQSFNLLPRISVYDNIALPLIYSDKPVINEKKKITNLLKSVGLADKISSKPNELSGGEQQRVAISRALVNEPPIILADEPTGNLDSKNGQEILNILLALKKEGKTIILVTHDQNLAQNADRIINIQDGKIV